MSIPLAIGTVAFANLVCHLTIIERPNVNGSWIETMAHPTDDPNPPESNQDGDDPPLPIDAEQPIEPDDANAQTT